MSPSLASGLAVQSAPVVASGVAPVVAPDHHDDESLLRRAVIVLSAVRQVARKMADHTADLGGLGREAAGVDVLTTYCLDSFAAMLPRRDQDLEETLLLIQQPLGVDVVASVPGASTVKEALHGAYRAVLLAGARTLDDIWDAHSECPSCQLCSRICGQTAALELFRDCAQDGAFDVDREVFGSGYYASKMAKRMDPAKLQDIAVRFARLAVAA